MPDRGCDSASSLEADWMLPACYEKRSFSQNCAFDHKEDTRRLQGGCKENTRTQCLDPVVGEGIDDRNGS